METASCVFIKQDMVVICYVDDLLVFFHKERGIEVFKSTLLWRFVLKDLVHLKPILGIELLRNYREMIGFCQSALIKNLLATYGMGEEKETHNPMSPSEKVSVSTAEFNDEREGNYESIVGSLLYIAIKTRLVITTATNLLETSVSRPEGMH